MKSIRKRLLFWIIVCQVLTLSISGGISYFYTRGTIEDLLDDRLRELALSLPDKGPYLQKIEPLVLKNALDNDDADFVIQIWHKDGTLVLRIDPEGEGTPNLAPAGFSTHFDNGVAWRSYVLHRNHELIQISQPYSDRIEIETDIAFNTILPTLILIVVLGVLVYYSVQFGLAPLHSLSEELKTRTPHALKPLSTAGLPSELLPLVTVLNGLLERLDKTLKDQKNFIADAAHELRTPLAAVQLQAQLLGKVIRGEDREEALQQVLAGTERVSHLVHQLLTLARLDPEDWERPFTELDLGQIVRKTVSDLAGFSIKKNIDLGISDCPPLVISGDAPSLHVMLENIVDNALRYTPEGGTIDIRLARSGTDAQVEISDNGPGIPEKARGNVFRRFYRQPGVEESGSGLGLAIVKEIVERHQGQVSLHDADEGSGLKVVIRFPLLAPHSPH